MRTAWLARLAATGGLALAAAGAPAQVTPGTVATVNGAPISVQQLERRFEREMRARSMNIAAVRRPDRITALKREVLEHLIREELLWQKARADGLVASDADVARAIEETAARFKSREAFERRVAVEGYDDRSYREYARRMLSADRAAQALVEGSVAVTDEAIERFYRDNPARFHRPEQLRLRVLQLRAAEGARERLAALRERLVKGEAFDALARRESDHPTRPWGGAMDPIARGQLSPPLEEAAFRLQPGELSGIVAAPDGLYLLKLEERLPEVTVPLEAARGRIRDYLAQSQGRAVLDREVAALRAASEVEVLMPQ